MKKIIILRGLPASGKSTYAKQLIADNPGKYARVNKDDLREMMHNGRWSKHNERLILLVRDMVIVQALNMGQHVIVDDTNLHHKHIDQISELAKKFDAEVEIKDFEISVEAAVKRDLKRVKSVGRDVIEGMYKQFLQPKAANYSPPEGKPEAIIVDVDGTLAHMSGRSPFDWSRVKEDTLDHVVAGIVKREKENGTQVIILTGRDGSCEQDTRDWLDENGVEYDELYIRRADDNRKDAIIKAELFNDHIAARFNVKYILDDRNQVVEMWRQMGLKVLQVADGSF